jgi:hypothetical protein
VRARGKSLELRAASAEETERWADLMNSASKASLRRTIDATSEPNKLGKDKAAAPVREAGEPEGGGEA